MAKNLVATEKSLELYLNGNLQKTFPRGEIKTEVTPTVVRVHLLTTGDSFSLTTNDKVDGQTFASKELLAKAIGAFSIGGGNGEGVTKWEDIEEKPIIIASGETQAEARESIGAGTSNLTIGTTATTAMAGNKVFNNLVNSNTTQPNVKFWTGTQTAYDAITVPDPDTIYFIKP